MLKQFADVFFIEIIVLELTVSSYFGDFVFREWLHIL